MYWKLYFLKFSLSILFSLKLSERSNISHANFVRKLIEDRLLFFIELKIDRLKYLNNINNILNKALFCFVCFVMYLWKSRIFLKTQFGYSRDHWI